MLTKDEIDRYKRHLLVKQIGGQGQQRLKAARVLIIGAGGLGSPLIMYLAAAGIGHLTIMDDDTISVDNLQRQVAFSTSKIGMSKAEQAVLRAKAINTHVNARALTYRLTAQNAISIIADYDIIADGCDNFETRYIANDACYFAKKPLVFAALGQLDGYLSTFRAFEQDNQGNPRPSYRCLFPTAPEPGRVANCEEAGVLGPLAGVMGTLQATEIIKEILGIGETLAGRLLIYDALSTRFETIHLHWDPTNPLNGHAPDHHVLAVIP